MKITIKTNAIINLITPLQSVINPSISIPILKEVKLEFTKKELIATGDNLEVGCERRISVKSDESMTFCVEYQSFIAALRTIEDSEVKLEIYESNIIIKHKKGNFNLPCSDSKAYPAPKTSKMSKQIDVESKALKSVLKTATRFTASDDDDDMSNISLTLGKEFTVRATDRNRLFQDVIDGSGKDTDIFFSCKAARSLVALISDKADLKMEHDDSIVVFSSNGTKITVVQQQSKFPVAAFKNLINLSKKASPIKIEISGFVKLLKRVSVLSAQNKSMGVSLSIMKKEMLASCENLDYATKSEETIKIKTKLNLEVSYNYKFLIDVLSVFSDNAEIRISENNLLFILEEQRVGAISPILI